MKLKMQTISGPVIIDSNEVTQFYPDHESGGELTAVEYLTDGEDAPPGYAIPFIRLLRHLPVHGMWMMHQKESPWIT